MPMGMADVATVLFTRFLKFDPNAPDWPDRDRFVLSAGHGSMLLYALLYLTGYEDMTLEELMSFRQLGARTAGHPEFGHASGIETTTGPLGQGIANAVGMALAERMLAARFGRALVDHRTYVIASDGDLMEGISHEAARSPGICGLGRLIVLFDDNGISIDGPTSLCLLGRRARRASRPTAGRRSRVDGHDLEAVAAGHRGRAGRPAPVADRLPHGDRLRRAQQGRERRRPMARRSARPRSQRRASGSVGPIGLSRFRSMCSPPGARPATRGAEARKAWQRRLEGVDASARRHFERALAGELPARWQETLAEFQARLVAERPTWATRKASEEALKVLTEAIPELVGGSADLTGSNNTKTEKTAPITATDSQRTLHPLRRARACHGRDHERHGSAQRPDPLRRHLPDLQRLLPAGDPAVGADGAARHLRHDARLDRPGRGRSDPPAGRASGEPEGDPESLRLPASRCDRDGRMLGARHRASATVHRCWR